MSINFLCLFECALYSILLLYMLIQSPCVNQNLLVVNFFFHWTTDCCSNTCKSFMAINRIIFISSEMLSLNTVPSTLNTSQNSCSIADSRPFIANVYTVGFGGKGRELLNNLSSNKDSVFSMLAARLHWWQCLSAWPLRSRLKHLQ